MKESSATERSIRQRQASAGGGDHPFIDVSASTNKPTLTERIASRIMPQATGTAEISLD
jgi:hypothetical protein